MGSTHGQRKLVWQQEKYSLTEKKELEELDKNATFSVHSSHLAKFILQYSPSPLPCLLSPLFIWDRRVFLN